MTAASSAEPEPAGQRRVAPGVPTLGPIASGTISLLLVASVVVVPLFGLLIAPLGLIPVLRLEAASRRAAAAWGLAVAVLAVIGFSGLFPTARVLLGAYLLLVVVPVVTIGWWRRGKWTEGRWAAVAVALTTAACLGLVVGLAWPDQAPDAVARWVGAASAEAEQLYQASGVSRGELGLALDAAERLLVWIAPGLPIAYLVAVLFWIRPRLRMLGFAMPVAPFERYRSEEWLPAAFAVTGAGSLLLHGSARWVAVNLLLAVLILYFVHGLAIIRAHLARWVGRGWLVRWGVALLCVQGPIPLVVATLGLADSFVELRPRPEDDGGTA